MGLESWFVCFRTTFAALKFQDFYNIFKKQTEFIVNTKIAFAATEPTHLHFQSSLDVISTTVWPWIYGRNLEMLEKKGGFSFKPK